MSDRAKELSAAATVSLVAIGLMWFTYFRFHIQVRAALWTIVIAAVIWVFNMSVLVWLERRRKSIKD